MREPPGTGFPFIGCDFLVEKTTLVNGSVYARYPGALGNSIGIVMMDASMDDSDFKNTALFGSTTGSNLFDTVPSTSTWGYRCHQGHSSNHPFLSGEAAELRGASQGGDELRSA